MVKAIAVAEEVIAVTAAAAAVEATAVAVEVTAVTATAEAVEATAVAAELTAVTSAASMVATAVAAEIMAAIFGTRLESHLIDLERQIVRYMQNDKQHWGDEALLNVDRMTRATNHL